MFLARPSVMTGIYLLACCLPASGKPFPTRVSHASEVNAFLPDGWTIEEPISEGDLDGDSRPDLAVLVRAHDPVLNNLAVLVFSRRNEQLNLIGSSLLNAGCQSYIEINRRTLLIESSCGASGALYRTTRLRWNAKRQRMELIGVDEEYAGVRTAQVLALLCRGGSPSREAESDRALAESAI
jgi:hypothetical protein